MKLTFCSLPFKVLGIVFSYLGEEVLDHVKLVSSRSYALVLQLRLAQYKHTFGEGLYPRSDQDLESFSKHFERYYRKRSHTPPSAFEFRMFVCNVDDSCMYKKQSWHEDDTEHINFNIIFYKKLMIGCLEKPFEALVAVLASQGRMEEAVRGSLRCSADAKAKLEARFCMPCKTNWACITPSVLVECLLGATLAGDFRLFYLIRKHLRAEHLRPRVGITEAVRAKDNHRSDSMLAECARIARERNIPEHYNDVEHIVIELLGYMPK